MVVNITKSKAILSSLIDAVLRGEKVIITKNKIPAAELIPHKSLRKRKLGLMPEIDIPEDFNEESETINKMFYGSSK